MQDLFCIMDEKAQGFHAPFVFKYRGQALRMLEDLARDPQSFISKHPADYILYRVGTFDENIGKVEGLKVLEFVARASECILNPVEVKGGKG